MDHDGGYKLLFSHPQMVRDLLHGFVDEPWVAELDFATLERVTNRQVSDDLLQRENDLIWRVRWRHQWLYIYLMLEFQSTVDPFMAVRLLVYVGLLYQDLIRTRSLTASGKLPPVVPVVLYNGERPWTAATDLSGLMEEGPAGISRHYPRFRYALIEERRYTTQELEPLRNLAAALFRLEKSQTPAAVEEVVGSLVQWLKGSEASSLRRAFAAWLRRVFLPGRLPGVALPDIQDLSEVQAVLAKRVIEWTEQWKAEGLQQGLQEGLQQGLQEGLQQGLQEGLQQGLQEGLQEGLQQGRQEGLEAERSLLVRLARRRFDDASAQALSVLLVDVMDPERLAEIGEWIVVCDSGEDLLARLRAH